MLAATPKYWTYKEYSQSEEGNYFEVIKGKAIMSPAPKINHQRVLNKLLFLLNQFVWKNNIGEVFPSPVDVIFADDIILQPDIVFVTKKRAKIIRSKGIFGAPDLVVEIISDSSYKYDMEDKRKIFYRFGVTEYWVIVPSERRIEVLKYGKSDYDMYDSCIGKGSVKSAIIKGLSMNADNIF